MPTTTKKPPANKAPARKAPAKKAAARPAAKATAKRPARPARKAPATSPAKRPAPAPGAPETATQQILVESVPLDLVQPNPDNIRLELGDLDDLAASIAEHGVLQPGVGYRQPDGTVMLIAGHRRHAASHRAGKTDMPMILRAEPGRVELLEQMLAENNQRQGLDPIEEGRALLEIKRGGRKSLKAIAAAVNRSESWVRDRLALVEKLPEAMWPMVRNGDLGVTEATAIATTKGITDRDRAELAKVPDEMRARRTQELAHKAKVRAAKDAIRADLPGVKIEEREVWSRNADNLTRPATVGPFLPVAYGDKPGQISAPPNWHDVAHQVVKLGHAANHSTKFFTVHRVWNVRPELLPADAFVPYPPADVDEDDVELRNEEFVLEPADLPDTARSLDASNLDRWAHYAHPICEHHRRVRVPWDPEPVAVCLDADASHPDTWSDTNALVDRYRRSQQGATPAPAPAPAVVQFADVFTVDQDAVLGEALIELTRTVPVGLLVALWQLQRFPDPSMSEDGPYFEDEGDDLRDLLRDELARCVRDGTNAEAPDPMDLAVLHWIATTLHNVQAEIPKGLGPIIGVPDVDDDQEDDAA